jgi:ketosteroid isomerase-like protein
VSVGGDTAGPGRSPVETVQAWADAWRRLDAAAVAALFSDDATYVGALGGTLHDLPRRFEAAARAWRECRIDGLRPVLESCPGDAAVVRATYRFSGVTRSGRRVAYTAAATFRLRRVAENDAVGGGGDWRVTAFEESRAADPR